MSCTNTAIPIIFSQEKESSSGPLRRNSARLSMCTASSRSSTIAAISSGRLKAIHIVPSGSTTSSRRCCRRGKWRWSDASRHRGYGPGDLFGSIKVNVSLEDGHHLAGLFTFLLADTVDSYVYYAGAGLDPFRLYKAGHARGDHRQQLAALPIEPLGGVGMAALRTRTMIARMPGVMFPSAVTTVELSAQSRGATGQQSGKGAPVRGQQAHTKLPLIRRPMPAQDFSQWDQTRGGV